MTPEFWRGKRVFLTGHTGFKGSWLALWLQELGAEVTGLALAPATEPSLFELASVGNGMTSLVGDVRDAVGFANAMRSAKPEIVIHMAAQALVRRSYEDPAETYSTNVLGTVNLFDAVRQTPSVKAVINVTTDKCYRNNEWEWGYREEDHLGGHDPYSSSKACAELVSTAYRSSYFKVGGAHPVGVATARAGNVIGGGDWAQDRLIPDILTAAARGVPVLIRNPRSIRPWQHVLEPLHGYLMLAEALYADPDGYAEAWNFGPSDEDARPVQWIVENIGALWGDAFVWELDAAAHPHEANYLKLDCSRARSRLGWQPRWTLADALERIVAWHHAYLAGQDAKQLTKDQIHAFMRGSST